MHQMCGILMKWTPHNVPEKWMTTMGIWPWGTRIGPIAFHETYFFTMNFHFINRPHEALPFSCIQWDEDPTMYPKSEWHQGVYYPGAFKLYHFESTKPIFAKWISTLLTGQMQQFPFPAYSEMDTQKFTPKVNSTKGCMTLGHSSWTICSPRNLFLQNESPLY